MNGFALFAVIVLVWLGGFTFGRHAGKQEK